VNNVPPALIDSLKTYEDIVSSYHYSSVTLVVQGKDHHLY
jgi:hypothetical protein